jgi:hypothetical protein
MSAIEANHASLVDRFVRATPSITAGLVRAEGIATRASSQAQLNEFVAGLSLGQREQLASLLQHERRTTLFDSLVQVHEFCMVGNWNFSNESTVLLLESNGYTLFEEYLSRVE